MDINRFAVEALLFFSSAALLSQLAKYFYVTNPLTFPVYIALKMAILLLALLIILKVKRSSEIGEIVLLSALTFVAVG